MNQRIYQRSEIVHIIIAKRPQRFIPFAPPEELPSKVLNFLKECPKDISQLINPLKYFELTRRLAYQKGYELSVIYDDDVSKLIAHFNSRPQIEIVFIDASSTLFRQNYKLFNAQKQHLRYFYIYGDTNIGMDIKNRIYSPVDFLSRLMENQDIILRQIGIPDEHFNLSIDIDASVFLKPYKFTPTHNNYRTMACILGNFGYNDSNTHDAPNDLMEESRKANINMHSFERQKLVADQIKAIDHFDNLMLKEELIKRITGNEAANSPLIIIAPFHNPDIKKLLGENNDAFVKNILSAYLIEQTENYINKLNQEDKDLNPLGFNLLREKISFLDAIAYLHSSFTLSPIVRLPLLGKSIYKELSYFKNSTFAYFDRPTSKRKIKKTILNLGRKISEKTISKDLASILKERNGQIIAVSDLPIEWLLIDNIPLSFTHDICRLPETSMNGLVAQYAKSNYVEYFIPPDIIDKTLIITGAREPLFLHWHTILEDLNQKHNFRVAHCKSL